MITRIKLSRNVIKHYLSYVKLLGGPRGDAPADGDASEVDGAAVAAADVDTRTVDGAAVAPAPCDD